MTTKWKTSLGVKYGDWLSLLGFRCCHGVFQDAAFPVAVLASEMQLQAGYSFPAGSHRADAIHISLLACHLLGRFFLMYLPQVTGRCITIAWQTGHLCFRPLPIFRRDMVSVSEGDGGDIPLDSQDSQQFDRKAPAFSLSRQLAPQSVPGNVVGALGTSV